MTTTRETAAILEAIQALDNAGIKHGVTTLFNGGTTAAIVFTATWRELGFCECGRMLEDRRYKECEKCRDSCKT